MANGKIPSKNGKAPPPTAMSQPKTDKAAKKPPAAETDQDAISLLVQDHREVDALFAQFEKAPTDAAKRKLANDICNALKAHARLEEDLFYPAAYSQATAGLLREAQVEHASAKDLIAQIEASYPGDLLFDAKVKVLAEYIRHHVAEEEGEIFPLCRKSGADLDALGRELATRKRELMRGAIVSNPVYAIPA
jgi:hemerythrin superfamily protein